MSTSKPCTHLIDGFIPRRSLISFYGDEAASVLVEDLGFSVAYRKKHWHGIDVNGGPTFYATTSSGSVVGPRLEFFRGTHGIPDDTSSLMLGASQGKPLRNMNMLDAMGTVDWMFEASGYAMPSLIVIDGFSPNVGEAAMKGFSSFLKMLHATSDTSIILVSSGRGSKSLRAALDAEYEVTRSGDDKVRMTCKQKRLGAPLKSLSFDLQFAERLGMAQVSYTRDSVAYLNRTT